MAFGNKTRRKVVMIDGSNLFASAQAIHLDLDYTRLRNVFAKDALRTYYYTALPPDNESSKLRPLMDWMQFNGYTVVSKSTKTFTDPVTRERRVKGNMDIDIAVDAMSLMHHMDELVLFTGDGDFVPLLKRLQQEGIVVTVVSTLCERYSSHQMIADDLRKQCDVFIDLDADYIRSKIARDARISPS